MNVLQVVPELSAGGVERTTLEIAEALSRAGYTPHIASAGGRLEPDLKAIGGVLHKFNVGRKNPLSLNANTQKLVDIIQAHKIDIVHARSRAPAWPALKAARKTQTAFVTTYHGIYNSNNPLKTYYNSVMAKGDHVIANSNFTRTHILKTHKISENIITVIPRGVDMKKFDPEIIDTTSTNSLRTSWNIGPDEVCILLPGRLTRWKGQAVAIKALKTLPKSHILVCLGDAQGRENYVQELKALAKTSGVMDRLRLPGHFGDMPRAYMAANVVISTSTDPEAFGRVMAEAQAMRRPVIASAHGGSLETIIDGQTGLLAKPGHHDELSHKIQAVLSWSASQLKDSRSHIEMHYSKTRLQRDTLDVYRKLL